MLASHEVVPFLSHANPLVRDHSLRCLSLAGEHCGTSAEPVFAAIDAKGEQAFERPEQMAQIPHTPTTFKRAARWLSVAGHPAWVKRWLICASQSLITSNPALVADIAEADLRKRLEARLQLQSRSPDELWNQLQAVAPGSELAGDLLQVLAGHDEFVMPRVMAILRQAGSPQTMTAIELAGMAHIGSAVPLLVDRLESADGTVRAAAMDALAGIGAAGVVTTIEQRCARGSASFRCAAADCLGRLRVPSVEATLLRLLLEEDDPAVRVRCSWGLADICTRIGFERLYAAVRESGDAPKAHLLRGAVAALARMLGRSLPEMELWEQQVARRVQRLAMPPAENGQSPAAVSPVAEVSLGFPADDDDRAPSTPASAGKTPIRRNDAKVGRNDPCPCGSGKKYKKCCGA